MTLRDLPPVRALAEERAREVHDAAVRAIKARHLGSYAQSIVDTLPPMWVDVDAHLALLCDLSRPDSRDAVARLVAAKVGIECGATAPQWAQEEYHVDGERTACWILSSKDRSVVFYGDYDSGPDGYSVYRRVSGVDNITDPAEALARVAIAVLA